MTETTAAFITGAFGIIISIIAFIFASIANKRSIKTNENLEKYKKELELKFNKATLIYNKEYDILLSLWSLASKACNYVLAIYGRKEYHNLDDFSDIVLDEFLQKAELLNSDKESIRQAINKTEVYLEIHKRYELKDAINAIYALQKSMDEQRPFIKPELLQNLADLVTLLHSAFTIEEDIYDNAPNLIELRSELRKDKNSIEAKKEQLLAIIHQSLYSDIDT